TSTRDDLVGHLKVPAHKIDVVPLGIGLTGAPRASAPEDLRARLDLGDRRVILSVSAKRPHKNLERALEALALIPAERRPVFVNPGYPTDYEAVLRERAAELGVAPDLRLLDWVSAEDLEGLYALADAFVFPS